MTDFANCRASRRTVLAGGAAGLALLLPGCQTLGDSGFSLTDAIRRLLEISSERAFARLTAPGGYWDDAVASIGLNSLLGTRGDVLSSILTSVLFKDRLEGAFADIAVKGAERAAPIIADAVRVVGINAAIALVNGGPTAATAFLQGELGGRLVTEMVPELGEAMRIANEPLVGQLLGALTGVDLGRAVQSFAGRIDDAIWREIGIEESAIRANPQSTNDLLVIGVFGVANRL